MRANTSLSFTSRGIAVASIVVVALLAACGGGADSPPAATYTVGGTLVGLAGPSELKISLNGGVPLALGAPGSFRFANALASGTNYAVTIDTQPAGQTCTVTGGSGVLTANVGNIAIACVTTPPTVNLAAIAGTITGMAPGTTLTLVNHGIMPAIYSGSGSFSFTNVQGTAYSLSVARNPAGQWCKVIGGAGIATAATTPVTVNCRSAQLVQLAGSGGGPGSSDGLGTNSRFKRPMGMVVDSSGNLFVADSENATIRKVSQTGVVTTFAGSPGQRESVDGMGSAARFGAPRGLAIDSGDNLYVTDAWFSNVRMITPAGMVTTLVDRATITGHSDINNYGLSAIARAADGSLYVALNLTRVIRKRTPDGAVTTLAGKEGICGHVDGTADVATLCAVTGMALDASGNLVVIDAGNQLVRKVSSTGTVSTLAGMAGEFGGRDGPGATALFGFGANQDDYGTPLAGIVVEPSGSVLVADYFNGRVRRIAADGNVTTAAGLGAGYIDGAAESARFTRPTGLAMGADGQVFIAEDSNMIRKLASGQVTTFAGKRLVVGFADGAGSAAQFRTIDGMAVDASGNIYVSDRNNNAVRKVSPQGLVTTLARNSGEITTALDDLNNPSGMAIDRDGNLYVTDRSCVRKIGKDGTIITLAGSPVDSGHVDAVGIEARFHMPRGLAVDDNGNVFVAEAAYLRKITPNGTVSTIAHRAGPAGEFGVVNGLAVDRAGNLYFSDWSNNNIRKLSPDGIMSTLAGSTVRYSPGGSADGQGTAASFSSVGSIALDSEGNLYVADGDRVRMITPAGAVSTLLGVEGHFEVHEGPLPARLAGAVLTVGPDDQLYISSANGVLTVKLR